VVGSVTRLPVGESRKCGSILERVDISPNPNLQTCTAVHQGPILFGEHRYSVLEGEAGGGVKPTTHAHLVTRLRMRGS